MTTSISRNKMLARMSSNDDNAYAAAKKGAHFTNLLSEEAEYFIVSIDRENGTLTYKDVEKDGTSLATITAEDFNKNFLDWHDNSQARYGKQCRYNWEIESVWVEAHREHDDFLIREAATAGDVDKVMSLLAAVRAGYEEEISKILVPDDTLCVVGDQDCELCN